MIRPQNSSAGDERNGAKRIQGYLGKDIIFRHRSIGFGFDKSFLFESNGVASRFQIESSSSPGSEPITITGAAKAKIERPA